MKRILAALDLTAHADRAFERAEQLRSQHGAELVLAHVVPTDQSNNAEKARERAELKLHSYKAHDAADISYRIRVGNPGQEVAALAADVKAELIVLGLHHDRPILDQFIETVAHYAIGRCACPVLIVKERCNGPYRRVLMAANFSPSARNAARAAIQLAPQSAFHILHAYETPFPVFIRFTNDELMDLQEERLAQIRRDLEDEKRAFLRRDTGTQFPDVQIMLDRDEVDAGIAKAVREIQPDLLTMGMKSFGFAALGRSRTEAYLSGPSCDVLVAA